MLPDPFTLKDGWFGEDERSMWPHLSISDIAEYLKETTTSNLYRKLLNECQRTTKLKIVEKIVLASCSLHKLLGTEAGTAYVGALEDREDPETREVTPGLWRTDQALTKAPQPVGTNPTARAKTLREYVCT